MEAAQRRRIRDFVALVIPTVWLCGIVLLGFASGVDLSAISAAVGFVASFAIAAYQSRPKPMDRRVLRPIVTGSLLLIVATLAPRVVARQGIDPSVAIGASLGLVGVTVLLVRS